MDVIDSGYAFSVDAIDSGYAFSVDVIDSGYAFSVDVIDSGYAFSGFSLSPQTNPWYKASQPHMNVLVRAPSQ